MSVDKAVDMMRLRRKAMQAKVMLAELNAYADALVGEGVLTEDEVMSITDFGR